jgi:two-component system sensor histidine kinase/response regulator
MKSIAQLRPSWTGATLCVTLFAAGVLASAACAYWLAQDIADHARSDFQRNVDRVADDVFQRFQQPVHGLKGTAGLFAVGAPIDRAAFRAFFSRRDLPSEFPGVRGFGFIKHVQRDGLDAFTAAARADGAPQFTLREAPGTTTDDLYVTQYIEPAERNVGLAGTSVGAEPARLEGLMRALQTGQPTLTGPLMLTRDKTSQTGFAMLLPVLRNGTHPTNAEERVQALQGFVFAPLIASELLAQIPEVQAGLVAITLTDADSALPDGQPIFESDAAQEPGRAAAASAAAPPAGRFHAVRSLSISGRSLTLDARSAAGFDDALPVAPPWVVFAAGVLASGLLASLLSQLASGRRRAEGLARDMTAELDRLAQVVKHTSNAVTITDRDLRITWVNEGFTRITGYTLAEAIGRPPGELLSSHKASPEQTRILSDSAAAGTSCRVEILNRAKDGREYWIDTEVQPLHDDSGALIGFMEIGSDVTERRVAQDQREAALRESQSLQRGMDLHAIVSMTDRDGRITHVNDAFCRMSGYGRDELLGQTHRIVNSGVQPAAFWAEVWRVIASGTPWRGEICNRSKDGSEHWLDTVIAPFVDADGRAERYIAIRTDITASKNATRALARERLRLDNILEGTNVGTWEWNVETGKTLFNERWAAMVGYTLDELGPTTIVTWSELTDPEHRSHAAVVLERHLNGEIPAYEVECRARHKAGHWVWFLDRGKLFSRSDEGRPRWMAGTRMDITERKQAEAALRASQDFMDRTGRIARVGGWQYDLQTQVLHWSDETCRIHDRKSGHRPALDEAFGYYAPEARRVIEQAFQHCIETGEGYDLELPLTTALGRCIWVRTVGEAGFIDGRPVRLLGASQDITARHAMESEVRRNNEIMSSVLENLPCGLSVFDADLNLVASNREFRRLLGLANELFDGPTVSFEDVLRCYAAGGGFGDDVEAQLQQRLAVARSITERQIVELTGVQGRPLEMMRAPMPQGGFVTTYTDITERWRAEDALRRRERLMRLVIDSFPSVLAHWDTDMRCTLANRACKGWLGLEPHQMVGRTQRELTGADTFALNEPHLLAALRGEEQRLERSRVTPDGQTHHYELLYIPERDGDQVRGFISVVIDLTAMKRIQLELQERTLQAEQASISKGQFLANMSHEIRTPMNAILGMLSLLQRTELSPRQADYAGKTEVAARSLLGLINDILDYSKVEAGKMSLDPHPFEPDELMRNLSVILSTNLGAKDVEVLFDIDPDLPHRLRGDALRLQQVLINLGGNAIKFTAHGEVVVSVRVASRAAEHVTIEVAVRDSGIGIAPENQARIFSGFTQAEAATTRRFGGTGLGVAISQRLVALMGGELRLESALGQGSRFSFSVDLAVVEEEAASEAATQGASAAMRVLIADDNDAALDALARMGRSLGWVVDVAQSSEAALQCMRAQLDAGTPYQAVFFDGQMPGADGCETSRRMRELVAAETGRVSIMVTSHGRDELSKRSAAEQAMLDGFLVKPITRSMLRDAVAPNNARDSAGAGRERAPAASRRLVGLRLLVVEDNLNNQQVARELLEDEGATVTLAGDGKQAVEQIAAADPQFDVVLMDLQMPVMDGFAATRAIRKDLGLRDLAIVAMTANAMGSDRDACLAAGMNDHVGKPFELEALVQLLLRHAGQATPRSPAAPAVRPPLPKLPPMPELPQSVKDAAVSAGVDLEAGLGRLLGKTGIYTRMLRRYVVDLLSLPDRLNEHMARAEREDVARQLHSLKGLSGMLGAMALSGEVADAETALEADPPMAEATARVHRLAAVIAAACPAFNVLLAELEAVAPAQAPKPPAPDTRAFALGLRAIAAHLRNADMAAVEAMAELKRQFGDTMGARLLPVDDAIDTLEFERAIELCDALLKEAEAGLPA